MPAKSVLKGFAIIVLIFVIGMAGIFVWQSRTSSGKVTAATVTVQVGDTISDVARKLKEKGIITFESIFHLTHSVFGQTAAVAPGAYELTPDMSLKQIVRKLDGTPDAEAVTIPPNVTKSEMGKIIGKAVGWKDLDIQFFAHTMAGMQWQRYKDNAEGEFLRRYGWSQAEREAFLSLTALYADDEYDFFRNVYEPGTYSIPRNLSRAQVAGILIDKFTAVHGDSESADMVKLLDVKAMDAIAGLLKGEMELLPDIVAIPPTDVTLKTEGGRTYLEFTTAYWNKGRGPLELVGDPRTKGIKSDIDRKVFQRIYRLDGDYRERLAGTFLWHQQHLHYHFQGFAKYTLTATDTDGKPYKDFAQAKSTFCVRDSEPVDYSNPGAGKIPGYTICGKERQGISPGWADAYYYTYIDQRFDVTDAPVGQYLLTIQINPEDRFDEVTKENDKAEALVLLNVPDDFVKVIEERSYGK